MKKALSRALRTSATVAFATLLAFPVMAGDPDPCDLDEDGLIGSQCGGNDCYDHDPGCRFNCDMDGDGHSSLSCGGADCDDGDAGRWPGNIEVCDLDDKDEDCDGSTVGNTDVDGDGAVDAQCCNNEWPWQVCGTDCDDQNAAAHAGQGDFCDGTDNDCDGLIDEAAPPVMSYLDADGDGWGDNNDFGTAFCAGRVLAFQRAVRQGDCNDNDPATHPGQYEVCNNLDDNCNGKTDEGISGACE